MSAKKLLKLDASENPHLPSFVQNSSRKRVLRLKKPFIPFYVAEVK